MELKRIEIDLTPEECMVPAKLRIAVARHLHIPEKDLPDIHLIRRTLDCRRHTVLYHCIVSVSGEKETMYFPKL